MSNALCEIAAKWGTDKHDEVNFPIDGDLASFYHNLLKDRRQEVKKVLEIGIGTKELMEQPGKTYIPGASLFMWADYFPNAHIVGLDVVPEVMINEYRISSFVCDQGDPKSLFEVKEHIGDDFDLIVDDGSHIPHHQSLTFGMFIPLLNRTGHYVIEDIRPGAKEHLAPIQLVPTFVTKFFDIIDIRGGVGNQVMVSQYRS